MPSPEKRSIHVIGISIGGAGERATLMRIDGLVSAVEVTHAEIPRTDDDSVDIRQFASAIKGLQVQTVVGLQSSIAAVGIEMPEHEDQRSSFELGQMVEAIFRETGKNAVLVDRICDDIDGRWRSIDVAENVGAKEFGRG